MKIKGIIRGQSIELQDPVLGLEEVPVVIEVPDFVVSSEQAGSNQPAISDEERLVRLNRLFGAWKDQPEIDPIFAEIDRAVQENRDNLEDLVTLLDVKPFDTETAHEFGKIQAELRAIGKPTGEMDALIAAVARSKSDTVVTQNIRDFENIPHLKLENWLDC